MSLMTRVRNHHGSSLGRSFSGNLSVLVVHESVSSYNNYTRNVHNFVAGLVPARGSFSIFLNYRGGGIPTISDREILTSNTFGLRPLGFIKGIDLYLSLRRPTKTRNSICRYWVIKVIQSEDRGNDNSTRVYYFLRSTNSSRTSPSPQI